MIAKECCISKGVGISEKGLPSFDRALLKAGVGNYNLVRLSSILPANCEWIEVKDLPSHLEEGSLLPVAYSTVTSDTEGETIISTIGVGIPVDKSHVGVIMEYSVRGFGIKEEDAVETLKEMIDEAFEVRGWELENKITTSVSDYVEKAGVKHTTFCCIAEW